ncbi:MAG: cupin domain-containing protein [Rubrivivax sp.]|nr:cupin domain-containing protein [Rubrivivax sp.]
MSNATHDRHPRAVALIATLQMQPHPEGGWYAEVFRSTHTVQAHDDRPARAALTSIDFLLEAGQASAWHRVRSDEVWHLLEGAALLLWLLPPQGGPLQCVRLAADGLRRHVVPADWWQAAEPGGDPAGHDFAYVGATVGPGFDFADFSFGRDDERFKAALQQHAPQTLRLL